MAKSSGTFTKGSKAASKAASKPRGPTKKTRMKEEAMRKVLEEQCKRELGIDDMLSKTRQKKTFELLFEIGERDRNVSALKVIADRIVPPKQFIQTETINPLPDKIEVVVKKVGNYDRDKDPEVTNYGKTKSATESNTG